MSFQIGQDAIMSLFEDWGPEDPYPLRIELLSAAQLSKISFLFGGIGDGKSSSILLSGSLTPFLLQLVTRTGP
jgi:hypothetical protein